MGLLDKFKKKQVSESPQPVEEKSEGAFLGFALLSDTNWDKEQLISDLKERWSVDASNGTGDEDTLVFTFGKMTASVGLMPLPVPNSEAERNAAFNYMWKDAFETTKQHKAHLIVSVIGADHNINKGKLLVKILDCCCRLKNTLGIYTGATVLEPRFYMAVSEMMYGSEDPILNWIWFGLYRSEKGMCCYTLGMKQFGKFEMEILDADASPSEVRGLLLDFATYVIEKDVTLKDGETIGFTAEDRHSITFGKGVSLPEEMLKISF